MVQFTIHGITFGKTPDHWWDNLTPWDSFSNLNKWTQEVGGDDEGIISISGGNCTIEARASGDDQDSWARLTLKDALTSGKLLVLITEIDSNQTNNGSTVTIYVGNDIDGWTLVGLFGEYANVEGSYIYTSGLPKTSLECINKNGSEWGIYLGGYEKTTLTLHNGLKVRFKSYASDYSSGSPKCTLILDKVYKK